MSYKSIKFQISAMLVFTKEEVISLQYTTWTRDVNWTYIRRSASECRMNVQFTPCVHEGAVSSKDVKLFTFRIFTWCRF